MPVYGRAYPVSMVHKDVFCKEVDRLEKLRVMKQELNSKCAIPAFIILKENGTIRFQTDFGETNGILVQKPRPLPKISTVLQELKTMWAT